jgi:hypothetical protein
MEGRLEPHFFNFVRHIVGVEIVDELTLTAEQQKAKKADVFFNARSVIAEIKLLATDTSPKIEPILAPYQESEEWPVFYGERPLSKLLEHLQDGKELHKKIYRAITTSLENIVADANRQIRETKSSFNLPSSRGILIVLNDSIDILDPNVMAHRVGQTLLKKTPAGEGRFPDLRAVWLLCETHTTPVPGSKGLLSVIIANPRVPSDAQLESFMDQLQAMWAAFNRMPMVRVTLPVHEMGRIPLHKLNSDPEPDRITRSDMWRREYRANPYLRHLTKDELLDFGARVIDDAERQFTNDAPTPTDERMHKLGRDSTAFFEEIEARNMDMCELTQYLTNKGRG